MNTAAPFASLLATADSPELGPHPREGVASEADLKKQVEAAFHHVKLGPTAQELVFALLLLWHDHIDAAHEIAQRIETAEGSFIHGIVHRREPDYGNAKYWFGRVGEHPCFAELARRARDRLEESDRALSVKLTPEGRWNPKAFIDACEEASKSSDASRTRALRDIQRFELEALLGHLASHLD